MDYLLCRRFNLKEIGDCKRVTGECSQTASAGRVEEKSKGAAKDQMVE